MNKHLFPLSLAFVALAVTGCQQDELSVQEPESNSPKSLVAVVDQSNGPSNSRVAFDNKGAFSWSEGDVIGVFSDKVYPGEDKERDHVMGNFYEILDYQRAFPWRITSGVGTPVGTFSWAEEDKIKNSDQTFDKIKYAVYPYIHTKKYELNHTVYDESHYVPESNVIFNTTEPGLAYSVDELESDFIMNEPEMSIKKQKTPMHMVGKVKDGKITFHYVTGALYVKLSDLPQKTTEGNPINTYEVVFFSRNRSIGGNYKVDMSRNQPFAESLTWGVGYNPGTKCYIDGNIPYGKTVVLPIACIPGSYNDLHIRVTGVPFTEFRDEFNEYPNATVTYNFNGNINVQAGQLYRMSNDTEKIDAVVKVDSLREEAPLNVKAPSKGAMVTIKFWSPKDYRGIKYVVSDKYGNRHTYNEILDKDTNRKSDYISEMVMLNSNMKIMHIYYNELSFKLNKKTDTDDNLHIEFYLVDGKGQEVFAEPFASITQ